MRAYKNVVLENILEKTGVKLNWFAFSQDTHLMAGFYELSDEHFGSVRQAISKK
jgi:hypothetical protein